MSIRITRRFLGPLLSGGLLIGICQSATVNLFAQYVPVGPPVPVNVENLLSPPPGGIPQLPPAPAQGPGVHLGQGYDGIDFLSSNCNCLPPDTNAAVANNFVVETVNLQIRVFDKAVVLSIERIVAAAPPPGPKSLYEIKIASLLKPGF